MSSKAWKETIAIYILPNIWRSKNNETMKSTWLIEHYIRNSFPEKSYTKRGGDPFLRNQLIL